MTNLSLSSIVRPHEQHELPSTATESMLTDALESDDIDFVKRNLAHVWAHYQSLEFFLSDRATALAAIQSAIDEPRVENDVEPLEFASRYYAGAAILLAYEAAHDLDVYIGLMGMSVPDALRTYYKEAVNPNIGDTIDQMEAFEREGVAASVQVAGGQPNIEALLLAALNDMSIDGEDLDETRGEDG